ncbi:hypothetical protein [Bradyrhizobium sp. Tv2a-2]|uniref:hypothetical protein n=1 Tax=Bradyrhizobium sp. Tv2a-2 TaxID=113395 RepID=UPI0004105E4F|nr:hypothetical protein [Bradyrhizobium sp. Tv2a-2]
MISQILIALAAGGASAAMFASITSGALISLVLLYLSPLPLMVAALGWGPVTAAIGGGLAAIGLGVSFGIGDLIAYAIAIALPACWLGHLCLLGRPVNGGQGAQATPQTILEWYPVGRILLWIVGFATLATAAALLALGSDAAAIAATLRSFLLRVLSMNDVRASSDTERWVEAMVSFAPPAAATVAMLTLTFNLWLAAKVAATSGRLSRPWPDLKTAALPPMTLVVLCAVTAFCFSGGLVAMLARIATAALVMAYALTGFAVLHTLTLAFKSRAFWLGSVYAFVVVFGWPMLAMAALGLADAVFGLRQRYLRSRPPPLPAP